MALFALSANTSARADDLPFKRVLSYDVAGLIEVKRTPGVDFFVYNAELNGLPFLTVYHGLHSTFPRCIGCRIVSRADGLKLAYRETRAVEAFFHPETSLFYFHIHRALEADDAEFEERSDDFFKSLKALVPARKVQQRP